MSSDYRRRIRGGASEPVASSAASGAFRLTLAAYCLVIPVPAIQGANIKESISRCSASHGNWRGRGDFAIAPAVRAGHRFAACAKVRSKFAGTQSSYQNAMASLRCSAFNANRARFVTHCGVVFSNSRCR